MKHNVLFVDDEINILKSLQRGLIDENYNCLTANSGQEALNILESTKVSVIVTDMRMPGMSGLDLLKIVQPRYPDIVNVIFTGYAEISQIASTVSQINIFKFILKPWNLEADLKPAIRQSIEQYELIENSKLLAKQLEEKEKELMDKNDELSLKLHELQVKHLKLEKLTESLENADSIILAIASAIEAKDKSTKGHISRVSDYAHKMGFRLGLSEKERSILIKGAILHDIGKIGTPDRILNKPGPLTRDEFEIMKQHTIIGSKIISSLKSFKEIEAIIRHHHEKLDGSGYPDGYQGDQIDIYTRIVTVIDIYDAVTSDGPYRKAINQEDALLILRTDAEKGHLDPDIVRIFEEILPEQTSSE